MTRSDAALERALAATTTADRSVYGEGGSPTDDDSATNSLSTTVSSRTVAPYYTSAKVKSVDRSRGGKSPSIPARATFASPDGLPLMRDPARTAEDAVEIAWNKTKKHGQ
ncbi:hypothetical protein PF010_g18999 [Phytophthora fragariae]|uniref:Uncharacterized protein n=1 Tax=Phytophthora fragariae TaxID=53985 RepID=A0A6G0KJD4_9STRA|nr:hypothetical protein PF010_g18999 [Phytophthora fragariae]